MADNSVIFETVRPWLDAKGFTPERIAALDAACAALAGPPAPVFAFDPVAAIDLSVLKAAAPSLPDAQLAPWIEPIKAACRRFEINSVRRVAAFLTTIAHEGGFKVGARENMNYSATRMAEVWPGRFASGGQPNQLAKSLDRRPEEIANHVYANRMGNGPPQSGDGWRFRGNGPPQLTGRANHEAFAKAMGMPLDDAMDYIATLEGGIMAAAWFWDANDINRLADTPGVADETRRINGGETGLADRQQRFDRIVKRLLELERAA